MPMSKAAEAFFRKNPDHPMLQRSAGHDSYGRPPQRTDPFKAKPIYVIKEKVNGQLAVLVQGKLILGHDLKDIRRKLLHWPRMDGSHFILVPNAIEGKDAILAPGGKVILEGSRNWPRALGKVLERARGRDGESREDIIARNKKLVEAGQARLDEQLKARNLHEMMTGKYAPLYKGYKGKRRRQVEILHDSGDEGHPLHGLYGENRPS